MRVLAGMGFFTEERANEFKATALAEALVSGKPLSGVVIHLLVSPHLLSESQANWNESAGWLEKCLTNCHTITLKIIIPIPPMRPKVHSNGLPKLTCTSTNGWTTIQTKKLL